MNSNIDCVIPVHGKDLQRLPYCVSGVRRHLRDVGHLFIVSRETHAEDIRAAMRTIAESDYEIVPETTFMPITGVDNDSQSSRSRGWLLQQVIKLSAWRLVTTAQVSGPRRGRRLPESHIALRRS